MLTIEFLILLSEETDLPFDELTIASENEATCKRYLNRLSRPTLLKAALFLPRYQGCQPSVFKGTQKGQLVQILTEDIMQLRDTSMPDPRVRQSQPNNPQLPLPKPPKPDPSVAAPPISTTSSSSPDAAVAPSPVNKAAGKLLSGTGNQDGKSASVIKPPSSASSSSQLASASTLPNAVTSSSSSFSAKASPAQLPLSKSASLSSAQATSSSMKRAQKPNAGHQISSAFAKLARPPPPPPPSSSSSSSDSTAGGSRPMSSFFAPTSHQSVAATDPRLNNEKKRKIFRDVRCMTGVQAEEVIRAITAIGEEDLSEDIVIAHIISHRDGAAHQQLAALKELEDAQYDQALRESEKERDNIEMRKKRRKEELLNQLQIRIQPAEEFRRSVWLHGLPNGPPTPSAPGFTTGGVQAENEPIALTDSVLGCGIMQLLAYTFDSCDDEESLHGACLQAISSSGPSVALEYPSYSDLIPLRKVVVDLLMLEGQMLRYYKEESYPLLLYLTNKIDNHAACVQLRQLIRRHRQTISSHVEGSARNHAITKDTLCALQSLVSKVLHVLRGEKYLLEKGLAKIPTGGCRIPDVLRYKRLRPFMEVLRPKVNDDGFEFVEGVDGLELLSDADADVEDIISDSDDSDD